MSLSLIQENGNWIILEGKHVKRNLGPISKEQAEAALDDYKYRLQ